MDFFPKTNFLYWKSATEIIYVCVPKAIEVNAKFWLLSFLKVERPSSRNKSTFFTFHKSAILIWEAVGCRSSGVSINQNYFMETHSLWKTTECLGARIAGTSHINPSFWLNVKFLWKGGWKKGGCQKRVIFGGVPVVKLFSSRKGIKWVKIKLLR